MNIPAEVDGQVIKSAFLETPNPTKNTQIKYPNSFDQTYETTEVDSQEQNQLTQQLKDLGYM